VLTVVEGDEGLKQNVPSRVREQLTIEMVIPGASRGDELANVRGGDR
jgi:hypothetical protein